MSWSSWGEVYRHYVAKGCDRSDAAYRADQWEEQKRQEETLTAWRAWRAKIEFEKSYHARKVALLDDELKRHDEQVKRVAWWKRRSKK